MYGNIREPVTIWPWWGNWVGGRSWMCPKSGALFGYDFTYVSSYPGTVYQIEYADRKPLFTEPGTYCFNAWAVDPVRNTAQPEYYLRNVHAGESSFLFLDLHAAKIPPKPYYMFYVDNHIYWTSSSPW
jgi:hypothetical protein